MGEAFVDVGIGAWQALQLVASRAPPSTQPAAVIESGGPETFRMIVAFIGPLLAIAAFASVAIWVIHRRGR